MVSGNTTANTNAFWLFSCGSSLARSCSFAKNSKCIPCESSDILEKKTCILKRCVQCACRYHRCAGWTGQTEEKGQRTCKHLKEYLGDSYEKARVSKAKKKAYVPQHITVNVLLAHKYDEKWVIMSQNHQSCGCRILVVHVVWGVYFFLYQNFNFSSSLLHAWGILWVFNYSMITS